MPDGRIWDQDAFVSVCFRPKADIRYYRIQRAFGLTGD